MPHRKLVQIGRTTAPVPLPTVAQYFKDLAARQGEDIRLLKERAAEREAARRPKSVREDSWRLHPVVPDGAARKKSDRNPAAKKRSASRKRSATKRH